VSADRAAAPSGVVTFLFTDIEGSTRRWEADAAAMRVALMAHDEVLRSAIDAHEGFLFSHTGDRVAAAFASPRSAVDAAVAAQRGVELPVRMGSATGEAELRDGDYFGTVLNRAARVMAAGHGGQNLLDDAAAHLLSGVDLIAVGARRLRDIAKPVDRRRAVTEPHRCGESAAPSATNSCVWSSPFGRSLGDQSGTTRYARWGTTCASVNVSHSRAAAGYSW
jgi:class 3 adenylate cyclase